MTKKAFAEKLGATIERQDAAVLAKFAQADSILSNLPKNGQPQHQLAGAQSTTKVVRGSYSMSADDLAVIAALRKFAAMEGTITTASEVIRIAIHAIRGFNGVETIAAIAKLERLRSTSKK